MKRKNLIVLGASVVLVLALVLTGCPAATPTPSATATPTPTATVTPTGTPTPSATPVGVELSYNFLNPKGLFRPVEIEPLAERLDTLKGKVIWVNQGEADPVIMPALYEIVQQKYPDTTWKNYAVSSFGQSAPDAEQLGTADAVIRGIAW